MLTQNLPEFWEERYTEGQDDWDLGTVTPSLLDFFNHPICPKSGRILVLGAGRGWDAEEWAKRGYEVVAVDFCPTAVDCLESLSRKYPNLTAVDKDLFELQPKAFGQFDVIYEYTCFSAIHPGRRDEYFEVWQRMLKDDGFVAAFFFPISNASTMQGPPHATSEGELMARLDGIFNIESQADISNSPAGREGLEKLWILRKEL
jgi:SAM-dependent methyltransferase